MQGPIQSCEALWPAQQVEAEVEAAVQAKAAVQEHGRDGGAGAPGLEAEEASNPQHCLNLAATQVTSRWQRESEFVTLPVESEPPKQRQQLHRPSPVFHALVEPIGWRLTIAVLLLGCRSKE